MVPAALQIFANRMGTMEIHFLNVFFYIFLWKKLPEIWIRWCTFGLLLLLCGDRMNEFLILLFYVFSSCIVKKKVLQREKKGIYSDVIGAHEKDKHWMASFSVALSFWTTITKIYHIVTLFAKVVLPGPLFTFPVLIYIQLKHIGGEEFTLVLFPLYNYREGSVIAHKL